MKKKKERKKRKKETRSVLEKQAWKGGKCMAASLHSVRISEPSIDRHESNSH